MPPLMSVQGISKRFGVAPLFEDISFTVSEGDRIGVIGPNGSGKSTLMEILSGHVAPDQGEVAVRKRTRMSRVAQVSDYPAGITVAKVVERAMAEGQIPEAERAARFAETLGRAGFTDFGAEAAKLSGGWRKRLSIAEALVQGPEILLLDEPTNHLDLEGIEWLEGILLGSAFAFVVVSHDRYFLENVAREMAEIDPAYEKGLLRVEGNYSRFLEAKEEYLHAQKKRQESLENRVRTEIEWLRRGPKARGTKAKARVGKAHEMIADLSEMESRSRTTAAGIDFSSTQRKTKQLLELESVKVEIGGKTLVDDLNFHVTSGMRVGLVGPNGSGKTTLLRLMRGELDPASGMVKRADGLRIVYFDQKRELDPEVTLRRALAPDSDAVIYQGQVVHVASWAARFLFDGEDLNQRVGRLSGGERARVLIAQLMLQPADVLLLDEPTNDLDIPTLEVLEESLLEFGGALVLVTHDRYLLDRVSTVVLGLDGNGKAERFADYLQWEEWQKRTADAPEGTKTVAAAPAPEKSRGPKKKLTFKETKEFAEMEERIAAAESELHEKKDELQKPEVTGDPARLREVCVEMEEKQQEIERLYSRWAELEAKQA